MKKYIVTLIGLSIALPFSSLAMEEESTPKFTPPSFELVDQDENGEVSLSELDAYRKTMQEEMENEDGQQMNRRDSVSAFASFDKNKDGVVTEEEFAAHARYSNPGNGTGMLKANKSNNNKMNNSNRQNNKSDNRGNRSDRSGGGNGKSKGNGKS